MSSESICKLFRGIGSIYWQLLPFYVWRVVKTGWEESDNYRRQTLLIVAKHVQIHKKDRTLK